MRFFCMDADSIHCSIKEAMRYMGINSFTQGKENEEDALCDSVAEMASLAIDKVRQESRARAVWECFPLALDSGTSTLSFAGVTIHSSSLMRFFTLPMQSTRVKITSVSQRNKDIGQHGKDGRAVLLAATLGSGADALLRRCQAKDSAFALAVQGAAAAMIEAFVDETCLEICRLLGISPSKKRYSPGYGDVSLEAQRIFFGLLDTSKIGLSLGESLVMSPEKSVTAWMNAACKPCSR